MWRSVESKAFRRRFGRARKLIGPTLAAGSPLRALAEQARTTSDPPTAALRLGRASATAQAHDNRHAVLILLSA